MARSTAVNQVRRINYELQTVKIFAGCSSRSDTFIPFKLNVHNKRSASNITGHFSNGSIIHFISDWIGSLVQFRDKHVMSHRCR